MDDDSNLLANTKKILAIAYNECICGECASNSFHYEYIKDINVVKMTRDYAKITKANVITSGTSITKKEKKYDLLKKKIISIKYSFTIVLLRIMTYLYDLKKIFCSYNCTLNIILIFIEDTKRNDDV